MILKLARSFGVIAAVGFSIVASWQSKGIAAMRTTPGVSAEASAVSMRSESSARRSALSSSLWIATPEEVGFPSHDEWLALSSENRELYLIGLQFLLRDLNEAEAKEGLKYEVDPKSVRYQWPYQSPHRSAFHAAFQSALQSPLMRSILSEARANPTDRTCIYAGWLRERDFNNRYCQKPPSEGCTPDSYVKCNPLLFGDICVQGGNSATSNCVRQSKPLAEIRQLVTTRAQEWNTLRTQLVDYCRRGQQEAVCRTIVARINDINSLTGAERVTVAPQAATARGSRPIRETPAQQRAGGASGRPQAATRASGSAPTVARTTAAPVAQSSASAGLSSECRDYLLIRPGQISRIGSGSDGTFMSVAEARFMMCSTRPPPESWLNSMRSRLEGIRASAARSGGAEGQYNSSWITHLQRNFNRCAEVARRGGGGLRMGGSAVSIVPTGSASGTVAIRVGGREIVMYPDQVAPVLRAQGAGICSVNDQTGGMGSYGRTRSNR